jgi:FkbM family methyltransferase
MTTSQLELIFDVGLHKGEDTAAYLAQGYRVVAFEADPALAAACRARFASDLASGRLVIVEGAIAPGDGPTVSFYRNPDHSYWGTIHPAWAERNARFGAASEVITLPRVDFVTFLRNHGVPRYLKIDIEGADRFVLESLAATEMRPDFVSIESEKEHFNDLEAELKLLDQLGYRSFLIVQQDGICGVPKRLTTVDGQTISHVFEPGGSGPWGRDLDGTWLSLEAALATYRKIFRRYRAFGDEGWVTRLVGRPGIGWLNWRLGVVLAGWHDVHARLAGPDS